MYAYRLEAWDCECRDDIVLTHSEFISQEDFEEMILQVLPGVVDQASEFFKGIGGTDYSYRDLQPLIADRLCLMYGFETQGYEAEAEAFGGDSLISPSPDKSYWHQESVLFEKMVGRLQELDMGPNKYPLWEIEE